MPLNASPASPAISDQTKAEGEQVVREVFPQATIVRPSLAYGEDDHFFSRFAAMIRSSTVLPLIGGGATKFQPVFVGDVTAGLLDLLKRPDTVGKTYEFGGPQVILSVDTHLELMRAIGEVQDAPVIADIDTGYGNAVNVAYLVPRYAAAGVAAVVIEDKTFPKDNSLRPGGRQILVPVTEFRARSRPPGFPVARW